MKRIGLGLLEDRHAAKDMNTGKDLLSLMVKANMEDKEGMSDEDVLARMFSLIELLPSTEHGHYRGSYVFRLVFRLHWCTSLMKLQSRGMKPRRLLQPGHFMHCL